MNQQNLGSLLASAKAANNWSYEDLARACGGTPSATRLHQLINAPLKNFPDPATIRALSRATGESITDIVMASARSLRLDVNDADPDALHIPGLGDLPAAMREAIAAVGREASRLKGQAAHDQDTSTTHHDGAAMPDAPNASGQHDQHHEANDELELQRAARRRARKEQKTTPPAHDAGNEDDDALPDNWQELAAYKGPTSHLEREKYFDELGEEPHEEPAGE